jgi:endo-1,4-beta-xylanase
MEARSLLPRLVAVVLPPIVACASTTGSGPGATPPSTGGAAAPTAPKWDHSAALALPSLAEHMKDHFQIGAAVEPHHINDMGDIVAHHYNRLTAENSMKMGPLCPSSTCIFDTADKIATFAREHQLPMTGHAFVWHQMYPAWFFKDGEGKASKDVVSRRLHDHIFALTERYADVIDNWDVVNEAISDNPEKTYRGDGDDSVWYATFGGEEYVRTAFEYAAAAAEKHDPDVKLYYNDYNVVKPDKRRKIIEMVRSLREQGVRVDGVGLQAHWNLRWPSVEEIRVAIDELAAEKLLVKISELDINLYWEDDHANQKWQPELELTPDLERELTERYTQVFQVLIEKSAVIEHVTFWGVSDDRTWLNGWPIPRENHPLLFDREHQPKPALEAILAL